MNIKMAFRGMIFTTVILLTGCCLCAQTLDDLKKKKQTAVEEIKYTSNLLGKVSENHKVTLNNLRLLNRKIEQQQKLISAISSEVGLMNSLIDDNTMVVQMLTSDLENIKQEYSRMVQYAWKNRNLHDKILFLLSADNVNQSFRRYIYFKQYAGYRRKQVEIITSMQNILDRKIKDLTNQKQMKADMMEEQVEENKKLDSEKKIQNSTAQKLTREKTGLQRRLNQQKKIEQQLEREIQRIIEEEARKSAGSGKPGFEMTPEQKLAGSNFEQNRYRLPWPVDKGVITEKFGVHSHPVLKNVTVNNNGVNITTGEGTQARAVFRGEVSRVFGITGGNMAVIIRHGQYLTVYSNLVNVTVKKGDNVDIRQNLGTVFTDAGEGNRTILKFQIWKESKKLNPEEWLTPK